MEVLFADRGRAVQAAHHKAKIAAQNTTSPRNSAGRRWRMRSGGAAGGATAASAASDLRILRSHWCSTPPRIRSWMAARRRLMPPWLRWWIDMVHGPGGALSLEDVRAPAESAARESSDERAHAESRRSSEFDDEKLRVVEFPRSRQIRTGETRHRGAASLRLCLLGDAGGVVKLRAFPISRGVYRSPTNLR